MHPPAAHGPQSQSFHSSPHPPFSNRTPTDSLPPSPGPASALAHMVPGIGVSWYRAGTSGNQPSAKLTQGPGGGSWWRDPRCSSQALPHTLNRQAHTQTPRHPPRKCPSIPGQALAVISTRMLPFFKPPSMPIACLTCHAHATPCPCHRKPVKIPMPLGKIAHRVCAHISKHHGLTWQHAQQRPTALERTLGGGPNVSPAPHLDALDMPSYPTALTRRLRAPAPRQCHGLKEETHSCLPSEGVPGSHQTGAEHPVHRHPAGASQSAGQSASSPLAGRLKPSSQNHNRESVRRIDRLLPTTPGQISAQSAVEGCDLHHHLAHPPI